MIVLPRGLARSFQAVARSCLTGRPRGPAPPVEARVSDRQLSLTIRFPEVSVSVAAPDSQADKDQQVIVPGDAFAGCDTAGEVAIDIDGESGMLHLQSRTGPVEQQFAPIVPGKSQAIPADPERMLTVPGFLEAFHSCSGCTAKESTTRHALNRVQVRGKAGRVIGSDGTIALIRSGFRFPFVDELLIPAIPVFGHREILGQDDVRVGTTANHFVVQAGPWTFRLTVDREGRYPDVIGVVPRKPPTTVQLDPRDAEELLSFLGTQSSGESFDVILEVNKSVVIQAKVAGQIATLPLKNSTFTGAAGRIALSAESFTRALAQGCRAFRFGDPGKPLVAEAANTVFLAMTQPASAVVTASPPMSSIAPIPSSSRITMPPTETNGRHPPADDDAASTDLDDPLALAESVYTELANLTNRAARLVRTLKSYRRERKALRTAFTSLKALGLEGGRP